MDLTSPLWYISYVLVLIGLAGYGFHRLCIDRIKVAGFGKAVEAHRGTGDCRSQVSARAVSA